MILTHSAISSGGNMPNTSLPDWEDVLSSAARLQELLPDAVLVGGTASAVYADHRLSTDADHVLTDLRVRFDEVLASLESVAGWKTARIRRPVLILGSLDGIETGIRQLIRDEPLETTQVERFGGKLTVPTQAEILRIKGVLILKRNATRDYLDFVALADHLGEEQVVSALRKFDRLYPQPNGESAMQQLQVQLAAPRPYDLEEVNLSEYKNLDPRWHSWAEVEAVSAHCATMIFDQIVGIESSLAVQWNAESAKCECTGTIKDLSDTEVIQDAGRGRYVVWDRSKLATANLVVGQKVTIHPSGKVKEPSRDNGLGW